MLKCSLNVLNGACVPMIPLIGFYLNNQNTLFFQAGNWQTAFKSYQNVSPVVSSATLPFSIEDASYFLKTSASRHSRSCFG